MISHMEEVTTPQRRSTDNAPTPADLSMRIPIGICGRAGAGKDTVAQLLIAACLARGISASRLGLADKVKSMCADLYGFSHEQCHGSMKDVVDPRYNQTPRYFFQRFGTEVARQVYPDTWIDYALAQMRSGVTFIPDVRFPNEAAGIRAKGGIIIGVPNDRVDSAAIVHESEAHTLRLVGTAECRIQNHGSMSALENSIPALFDHILFLIGVSTNV